MNPLAFSSLSLGPMKVPMMKSAIATSKITSKPICAFASHSKPIITINRSKTIVTQPVTNKRLKRRIAETMKNLTDL